MRPLLLIERLIPIVEENPPALYRACLAEVKTQSRPLHRVVADFRAFIPDRLRERLDARGLTIHPRLSRNPDSVLLFVYGSHSAIEEQNRAEYREVLARCGRLYRERCWSPLVRVADGNALRRLPYSGEYRRLFAFQIEVEASSGTIDVEQLADLCQGPFMITGGSQHLVLFTMDDRDLVAARLVA